MTAEADRQPTLSAAPAVAVAATRWLGVVYALLVAAMVAPIAVWPIPRSWDLVNHWARLTLYHLPPGDPLAALYQVRLTLIPNLAIDLVYLALSPIFSAESVIRLAWVAAIALPAWGAWRLNKILFGEPQPIVLLAPALSYNLATTLGLINFTLGMALAIHALAWWLTIDRRRRWTRLAIFNGVAAVLFFCHIAAYAAFCVMVGLYEATPRPGEGRRAWAARVWPTPFHLVAGALLWLFTAPFESRFGGPGMKIASLAAPMIEQGLTTGLVETMALAIGLAIGLQRRQLTLAPAMRGVLVGLLAAIVVLPSASGAADFIDARLAVLLAYLAIASFGGPRGVVAKRWVAAVAVVVTLARVGEAAPDWSAYARQAGELRQAIGGIAPGDRVLVAEPPSSACRPVDAQDYLRGLTSFVVIDRRALVSTLFTGRGMQPVWARDPRMDDTPWLGVPPSWFARHDGREGRPNWRDSYDALLVLHVGCDWRPDLAGLTPISHTSELTIYRSR